MLSGEGVGTENELGPEAESVVEMQKGLSTFGEFLDEELESHEPPVELLDASISHFDAAIALQPDWAELYVCRAYAASAVSLTTPGLETEEDMMQSIASVSADVDRALELDPDLADAHLARAFFWSNGIMDIAWEDLDDEEVWFNEVWAETIRSHLDQATSLEPSRADIASASLLIRYILTTSPFQDSDVSLDDLSALWQQLYDLYLEEPDDVKPYFATATMLQTILQRTAIDEEWAEVVKQTANDALARDPDDAYGHLLRGLAGLAVAECGSDEMNAAYEEIGFFMDSPPHSELAEEGHSCASSMFRRIMETNGPLVAGVLAYICGVD